MKKEIENERVDRGIFCGSKALDVWSLRNIRKKLAEISTYNVFVISERARREDIRVIAKKELSKRPTEDITSALIETLKDEDWNVQSSASRALEGTKNEAAISALVAFLSSDGIRFVKYTICRVLAGIDSEASTSALIEALDQNDSELHIDALKALAGKAGEVVTLAIIGKLESKHYKVRVAACQALAGRESEAMKKALLSMQTGDNDEEGVVVKRAACFSLAGIKDQTVTTALIALMASKDTDYRVKEAACTAFAHTCRVMKRKELKDVILNFKAAMATMKEGVGLIVEYFERVPDGKIVLRRLLNA
jgi:HEAT repeat protein